MNARRRALAAAGLLAPLVMAGCAAPARAPAAGAAEAASWSGRLALQIPGDASRSFAASFDLRGSAQAGELGLFNPLGGTLAQIAWAPGSATLRTGSETRNYESLSALVAQVTGTAIPVAALFDWLAGREAAVPGWSADLSQVGNGRLFARRNMPAPEAELRVAFER